MRNVNFGSIIKHQLLTLTIKSPCCKKSFLSGTEIFARNRKNAFTGEIEKYREALTHKKNRAFFDETENVGYLCGEENGEKFPVSSGRVCPHCHSMMIRGAFLVCGRASRTAGNLHVEMTVPGMKAEFELKESLKEHGLEPKVASRRGEKLLYYKKREIVADFLAYIGAVSLSFDLINDTIMKETRASANRQKNCDTTNILKTVGAAERQIAAINAICEHGDMDKLSPELRRTAEIRLENPIESLDVITFLHGGNISRSGVNHRLTKLVEFAVKKGYIKDIVTR